MSHAHFLLVLAVSLAPAPVRATATPAADVPSIVSLAPASAIVGANGVKISVNGANFARTSVVRWRGVDRPTTYVSAALLQVDIPAADLTTLGGAQITVFNQGGNGGTSNVLSFIVGNPRPVITAISPTTVAYPGAPLSLVVTGSGFVPTASVRWNGAARPTTYEGPTRLSIQVPTSDLAATGTVQIAVLNPAPLGGTSAAKPFTVAIATPVISALSQTTVPIGAPFTLRVTASNLLPSATVLWNGVARPTTAVSATELSADIPLNDVNSVVPVQVAVQVSAPGTAAPSVSAATSITLVNPAPVITSFTPTRLTLGGPPVQYLVGGSGFLPQSVVTLNGRALAVSGWTHGQLMGLIAAQSPDVVGAATFKIVNPAPGGGSVTKTLSVVAPPPTLSSLIPQSVIAPGSSFTLRVIGANFNSTMRILWRGSALPTTFVSASELRAPVSGSAVVFPRTVDVQIYDSMYGTSAPLTFEVKPQP
jgi:trimeric autotransporter adhesin